RKLKERKKLLRGRPIMISDPDRPVAGSSPRSLARQRSVHDIFGSGIGIVVVLTVPALYERYEDGVDRLAKFACMEVQMYERVYSQSLGKKYFTKAKKWALEKKKLLTDV
ncbi:hypothetical protein GW17_00009107, partial [Ensete ventricosum]